MRRNRKPPRLLSGPIYTDSIQPVSVDTWRACVEAYQAGARFSMPVTNPSEYKVGIGDKVYSFPDNAMNRGIVAIKEFLRADQKDQFPCVLSRIMALKMTLEPIRTQARFLKFFKSEEEDDGSMMVSEALIDAFSNAEFMPGTFDVNLDSLSAIAEANLAADPD